MNTYKARITVHGRLLTPLRADTIFGHIAWGIARHEGPAAVEAFLDSRESEPRLVVSSAFPVGCLPMPLLPMDAARPSDAKSYAQLKRVKRFRYVPASALAGGQVATRSSLSEAAATLLHAERVELTLHNTVDRRGGGTLEATGLYQQRESWHARKNPKTGDWNPAPMDIHILSGFDQERLLTLLGWAFEAGFGAKSSTGAGRIELSGIEPSSLPLEGNRAMALGPFAMQNPPEIRNLRAGIFVRHGKLGQEFGAVMNPFKRPILFFEEGATFEPSDEKPYIGCMVQGIHADVRIRQHGFAPIFRFFDQEANPGPRRTS